MNADGRRLKIKFIDTLVFIRVNLRLSAVP